MATTEVPDTAARIRSAHFATAANNLDGLSRSIDRAAKEVAAVPHWEGPTAHLIRMGQEIEDLRRTFKAEAKRARTQAGG